MVDEQPAPEPEPEPEHERWAEVDAPRLLRTFALVGLCAFGGVMPWIYRAVVERRGWMDEQEFAEVWGQGLMVPGATSTNVAATLGYRIAGPRGAAAAVLGLIGPPFVIVLLMALLYRHYGELPAVAGAVRGVTAVAAGLVLATGIKLAKAIEHKLMLPVFGLAAALGVAALQLPILTVIAPLLPLAFAIEWRLNR